MRPLFLMDDGSWMMWIALRCVASPHRWLSWKQLEMCGVGLTWLGWRMMPLWIRGQDLLITKAYICQRI